MTESGARNVLQPSPSRSIDDGPIYASADDLTDVSSHNSSAVCLPVPRRLQSSFLPQVHDAEGLEDPQRAISPEVHAMYLNPIWTPVPEMPVPEPLKALMPDATKMAQLGAFHLHLLLAYQAALPYCSQSTDL
jgi:hypothetical protein